MFRYKRHNKSLKKKLDIIRKERTASKADMESELNELETRIAAARRENWCHQQVSPHSP